MSNQAKLEKLFAHTMASFTRIVSFLCIFVAARSAKPNDRTLLMRKGQRATSDSAESERIELIRQWYRMNKDEGWIIKTDFDQLAEAAAQNVNVDVIRDLCSHVVH